MEKLWEGILSGICVGGIFVNGIRLAGGIGGLEKLGEGILSGFFAGGIGLAEKMGGFAKFG